MNRRDFLQVAGVAGVCGALSGAIGETLPDAAHEETSSGPVAAASAGELGAEVNCPAGDPSCAPNGDLSETPFPWCRLTWGESSVVAAFYGWHRDLAAIPNWLDAQEKWLFEQENTWPTLAKLEHAEQCRIERLRSVTNRVAINKPLPSLGPQDTLVALFDCYGVRWVDLCAGHIKAARKSGAATVLLVPIDNVRERQWLEDSIWYTMPVKPKTQIVTFNRTATAFAPAVSYGEQALEGIFRLIMADKSLQERWFEIRPERKLHRRGFETRKYVHKIDAPAASRHIQRTLRAADYYAHHVEASRSNGERGGMNTLSLWSMIGRMDEWAGPSWDDASLVILAWGEDLAASANLDALIHFRESLPPAATLLAQIREGHQGSLLVFNGERLFEE